jgi:hypothetical protein
MRNMMAIRNAHPAHNHIAVGLDVVGVLLNTLMVKQARRLRYTYISATGFAGSGQVIMRKSSHIRLLWYLE